MKAAAWVWVVLAACGDVVVNDAPTYPPPLLHKVEPRLVLPSTALRLDATGLVVGANYELVLEGQLLGQAFSVHTPAEAVGPRTLVATVAHPGRDAVFEGTAVLRRNLENQDTSSPALAVELTFASALTPTLTGVSPTSLHLGDTLVAEGADLLLPSEGLTLAEFSGTLWSGSTVQEVSSLIIPGFTVGQLSPLFREAPVADPATRLDRRRFGLILTPDIFGIRATRFEGTLTLINNHESGQTLASTPLPLTLDLARPIVTGLSPERPTRGMWLTISGRGFIDSDGLLQTATLMVFEGRFVPLRGAPIDYTGPHTLHLFPEDLDEDGFVTVLRPGRDDALPFGAVAGRFVGRVSPLVLAGPDAVLGEGLDVDLEIGSPHQVVQVRLLPGFDEALVRFGLLAEREAVIERVLEVARRDFAGIHLSFVLEDPLAFAEYTIIELGGPDPNGTGLFGLDNTAGKDVGNERFDDVIGGFNAETQSGNLAAYGGVFASELMNLSPSLSTSPLASPRFDDIFGELAPELGGEPAQRADLDGPRATLIREAIRVLGNLIGSTVTHEVGHALGLTALSGRYHNDGDTPGALMDAGVFRPFEERAEIDGVAPASLEPFNRLYLESILPPDPHGP